MDQKSDAAWTTEQKKQNKNKKKYDNNKKHFCHILKQAYLS